MAKTPKMARKVSPEDAEAQMLADQVMQMMGEQPNQIMSPAGPVNPRLGPSRGSSNAAERAQAAVMAEAGSAYGGDGSLEAQTGRTIDELGEEALEMEPAELLQSLGFQADPKAVAAFEKLAPEERLDILRSMSAMQSPEDVATEAVARQPAPEDAILQRMGVE